MIHQQIKEQVKEAMRAKDALRLNVVRNILSSFTNELIAQKKPPQGELPDDEALTVIRKLVKQRKDSIEQFRKGNREDLASAEEAELNILQAYLPAMMSKESIKTLVLQKAAELGITDKSKANQLMGAVMKATKGNADGNDVKAAVDSLF